MIATDPADLIGMHFDEPWQREAWEAERAERARRRHVHEGPPEEGGVSVATLLEQVRPTIVPDAPNACARPRMPMPPGASEIHCDLEMHYRWNGQHTCVEAIGRCAEVRKRETQSLVSREEARLEGELEQIRRLGSVGFDGYDPEWSPNAGEALQVAQDFASQRPPTRNVFFAGMTGLGKTRLMLASHFALLRAGVRSVYVTSPDLRIAFQDQTSFTEELRDQGNALVERLVRTQVVHLDDLGNVEDDERKRGQFAEGLKKVLDRSRAVWFAATNLTWDNAVRHPDVGEKVLSRLVNGAAVVKLKGKDYRVAQAARRA